MNQRQAAERLGVSIWTLLSWEKARAKPSIEFIPAILRFLGRNPIPAPNELPERMLAFRQANGSSIREAARRLGVNPGTWGDWERGELILLRKHRKAVATLLGLDEQEVDEEMRTRWSAKHPR